MPDTAASLFSFSDEHTTRGHSMKMKKERHFTQVGAHAFSNRVVNIWNALPQDIVDAPSVNDIKAPLDAYLPNLLQLRY